MSVFCDHLMRRAFAIVLMFAGLSFVIIAPSATAAMNAQESDSASAPIRITPVDPTRELETFLESDEYDAARDFELSLILANKAVDELDYDGARTILRDAWKRMKQRGVEALTLANLHGALADVERLRGVLRDEVTHRRLVIKALEDIYGEGSVEAEGARLEASAGFARDGLKRVTDHPNSRSALDRLFLALRFAKESRKNLEKHHGGDHSVTRFAKAVEARLRVPFSGRSRALRDFEKLLGGDAGHAQYASLNDLYIERIRIDLLSKAGREEKVEAIISQLNDLTLDEPNAILIKEFSHRTVLQQSNATLSDASFAQSVRDRGFIGVSSDLLQPPAARYRGSWVDISYCVRRDGSVDEVAIRQAEGHEDWPDRVADALEARRYVSWRTDDPTIDCIQRLERFAVAVGTRDRVGSRIRGPSAFSEIVITDLLGQDGALQMDFPSRSDDLGR